MATPDPGNLVTMGRISSLWDGSVLPPGCSYMRQTGVAQKTPMTHHSILLKSLFSKQGLQTLSLSITWELDGNAESCALSQTY